MMGKEIALEEMHTILLDMLSDVDRFCRKNNIRYSLGGGTLLGAIRHKGFIPWDDDIDIMMPRPDYERFLKAYNGNHPDYECIVGRNDHSFFYFDAYAKVHDTRTLCNEERVPPFRYGIYIDVFPIDGMPVSEKECARFLRVCWRLQDLIRFSKAPSESARTIKQKIYFSISKLFSPKVWQGLCTKYSQRYGFSKTGFAGATNGRYLMKERHDKKLFEEYIDVSFEGYSFMAIRDYDTYLTKHYNEYMKLPPVEERENHMSRPTWL